ncbi:Ig-like domain-containing protein [Pseudomonas gozinkensis]|uniref:Ig-like domain-containing protein n=1 Tax=Pseudomonas gozinkensis TaxID=2774461 RepID=UPI001787E458|nr:Ig-like domain-containing protein [Pseudomonas gozinkensis]
MIRAIGSVIRSINLAAYRIGVHMDTDKKFEMDESDVSISGIAHSLQGHSGLMPVASTDTCYQRQPRGGKKPYYFTVDNPRVAYVDDQGIVIALTAGQVLVTATDASGQSKSYRLFIPNGHAFFTFGPGRLDALIQDANRERVRLATLDDLRVLHQRFGPVWPLVGGQLWSTTGSAEKPEPPPPPPLETGINYYTKDMANGVEQTNDSGHVFTALGRNL